MRHPFTYRFDLAGKTVLEIECLLSASAKLDGVTGDPVVTVERVYVGMFSDAVSIEDSGLPLLDTLADAIAKAAEADDEFCGDVIADEGIAYVGRGANDPDGRFVRGE